MMEIAEVAGQQQQITPQMWQEIAERLASVETMLEVYARQNEEMDERQKKMLEAVQRISNFIERMNGGVRVVLWLGGVAGAIGSGIAWIIGHVSLKP